MKQLLIATAVIELGAGVALLCCPSAAATLLLGSSLDSPATLALGRLAGAALLALGVACWLVRGDVHGRSARGVVAAMTVYNLGAVIVLGSASLRALPAGFALWSVVVLHAAMTGWCLASLLKKPHQPVP